MLLLLGLACTSIQHFDEPIPAEDPWERAAPSADALARYEAGFSFLQDNDGLALIVMQGTEVVFEAYANGHGPTTPNPFWSGTKTIGGCILAQLAVRDGLLTLDERVSDTFTEWQGDPAKEAMEVQHLLRFTSGLQSNQLVFSWDGFIPTESQRHPDKYQRAIDQPASGTPGDQWEYGSVHLAAFGALIERKLGGSPLDYLDAEIFEPIGMRRSGWNIDPDGNPMLAYGLWTSAPELTKLGVLLRDDGVFQGTRLLPEGTLATCMEGSEVNPAYGLGSWVNRPLGDGIEFPPLSSDGSAVVEGGPDLLAAAGAGGQRVYVIPSLDQVIVVQSDQADWADQDLLRLLLPAK